MKSYESSTSDKFPFGSQFALGAVPLRLVSGVIIARDAVGV